MLGWFDKEGRPGENNESGAMEALPAYRVVEGEGGKLFVVVSESAGAMSDYWSS